MTMKAYYGIFRDFFFDLVRLQTQNYSFDPVCLVLHLEVHFQAKIARAVELQP